MDRSFQFQCKTQVEVTYCSKRPDNKGEYKIDYEFLGLKFSKENKIYEETLLEYGAKSLEPLEIGEKYQVVIKYSVFSYKGKPYQKRLILKAKKKEETRRSRNDSAAR